MTKNLRWKLITIVAVLAAAVWLFYPPDKKVKLGLDLKGGVHLVLRVQTDDALRLETTRAAEQLRENLVQRGVTGVTVTPEPPTRIQVTGVPRDRDAEFRRTFDEMIGQAFNRESGVAGSYTLVGNASCQLPPSAPTALTATVTNGKRSVSAAGAATSASLRASAVPSMVMIPTYSLARAGARTRPRARYPSRGRHAPRSWCSTARR